MVTLGMCKQDLDSQREGGSSLWTQIDGEAVTAAELRRVLITNQSNTRWEITEISVPCAVHSEQL